MNNVTVKITTHRKQINIFHNLDPISNSSIHCLTTNSLATFSLTTERFDLFLDYLSTYTSNMSIEYEDILSIVSNCTNLVNYINTYQHLFIEYAFDDYLSLDEHFDLIFTKSLQILERIHDLPIINSEIYNFEKQLISYLPSNYSNQYQSIIITQITSTLIDQTSRLFSSTYQSLANENQTHDDNDNDCVISASFLFSCVPLSIQNEKHKSQLNDQFEQSRSLLQLDKINFHTTILTYSQLTPSFQFDLTDFEQIENDLKNPLIWFEIERQFYENILSSWSTKNLHRQTMNPWSSETFWTLIMNFKCSDMNLKYEFILIIQWCFCLLTIQALNRDWDLCKKKKKTLFSTEFMFCLNFRF